MKKYCEKCGKKLIRDADGDLFCPTIDKVHGFCCNDPDCRVLPFSKINTKTGKPTHCSNCGADCSKCDIILV